MVAENTIDFFLYLPKGYQYTSKVFQENLLKFFHDFDLTFKEVDDEGVMITAIEGEPLNEKAQLVLKKLGGGDKLRFEYNYAGAALVFYFVPKDDKYIDEYNLLFELFGKTISVNHTHSLKMKKDHAIWTIDKFF